MYPVIRSWEDYPQFDRFGNLAFHIGNYYYHYLNPIQPHRHEYLELSLVIEGDGCQIINSRKYSMRPGTFTFLFPYQVCEVLPSSQPMRLYTCIFDLGFLFRLSELVPGLKDMLFLQEELPPSIQLDAPSFETVSGILHSMLEEYQERRIWRDGMLLSKLTELLIRFERLRKKDNKAQNAAETKTRSTIWPVIHYIHTNYQNPISLSELSVMFNICRSHLSAEFKKYTGLNFVDFLHEIRIRHACSLLLSSDMPGTDIAHEVGFSSFKTFARIFRAMKGETPSQYRNNHRSQKNPLIL